MDKTAWLSPEQLEILKLKHTIELMELKAQFKHKEELTDLKITKARLLVFFSTMCSIGAGSVGGTFRRSSTV